jgi:hypothetical protein
LKTEKTRVLVQDIFAACLMKLVLDISSIYIICPVFALFSFPVDISISKMYESYLLLIVVTVLLPRNHSKISTTIIWLFIAITYVPSLTVYSCGNQSSYWIYLTSIFWLLCFFMISFFESSRSKQKIRDTLCRNGETIDNTSKNTRIISGLIILYTFCCIASSPQQGFSLDFTEIYEVRAGFRPSLPLSDYFTSWSVFVVTPLNVIANLEAKKYRSLTFFSTLQILFAGITGQKVVLFSLPLLIWLNEQARRQKLTFSKIAFSITCLIAIGSLSWLLLGDVWISAIIGSRLLILPAITCFHHYDFFSTHNPLYLSHSILAFFSKYPYDKMPWFIIGENYFQSENLSANAGLIADAYMNFRDFGVIAVSILFGFTLNSIDRLTYFYDSRLVMASVGMGCIWSLNGSFFSSIFSGGLLLAFLIIRTLPIKNSFNKMSDF